MKTLALILAIAAGVIALAVFLALALEQWLCDVFDEERHREEDEQP